MKRLGAALFFVLAGAGCLLASGQEPRQAHPIRAGWMLVKPSDLGPAGIDVSSYPKELQDTYKYVIPERCLRCHTAARIWNSPFIEMTDKEQEAEKKLNPALFEDADVAVISDDVWKRYIKRMQAFPACCGGCSDMSEWEVKDLHRFLKYDSIKRKTGSQAAVWIKHRKKLVRQFNARRKS